MSRNKADNCILRVCGACVLMRHVRMGGGEGEKLQSSACLSGHTIQHRERSPLFSSLPTPLKLPSNSAPTEWTGWHDSADFPSHPRSPSSPGHCLFFSARSSFEFCTSSSPTLMSIASPLSELFAVWLSSHFVLSLRFLLSYYPILFLNSTSPFCV